MQDYDERYCRILGHRTSKALISMQKVTQTRTSLSVPGLLGWTHVLGACTSSAPYDVIQTPDPDPLLGSNRQWQTGAHTQYNPVPILHIRRPECADESAGPFLLPLDDFLQTLQWRSQVSKPRDLLLAVTPRSDSSTFRWKAYPAWCARGVEAAAAEVVGFPKPINPYSFLQFARIYLM